MRIISILLVCLMLFTGCGVQNINNQTEQTTVVQDQYDSSNSDIKEINFPTLDNKELLTYIESNVYEDLIDKLNSEEYFVENISAKYISKEYLDEVAYNSQSNIYFGYTLDELLEQFEDTKFVFTLGDDGQTTVKEFEAYVNPYDKVIKNVATGAGVILICATVSVVSNTFAPAVSVIFAASAKTGTIVALSDGLISGVVSCVVTGIETKDFDKALDAALLDGSEGFKWGAIAGSIAKGVGKATELKGLTLSGLSMNDAALIQRESKYSSNIIKKLHSYEEYKIYKNTNLKPKLINNKETLIREIDWKYKDSDGITNLERAKLGKAALDPTGTPYELHHIGQVQESPLAILTKSEHSKNNSILHKNTGFSESLIDRPKFEQEKKNLWKAIYEMKIEGKLN